jgi:hypothetical protein
VLTGEEQSAHEEHNGMVGQRGELLPGQKAMWPVKQTPLTKWMSLLVQALLDERLAVGLEGQEHNDGEEGQRNLQELLRCVRQQHLRA